MWDSDRVKVKNTEIERDLLSEQVQGSEVRLIVVGIALDPPSVQNYKTLCGRSREGIFIETADSDALITSYQSVSNVFTKSADPELSIEYM